MTNRLAVITALLLVILPGCRPRPRASKKYSLTGTVVSIDISTARLTVTHGDIPGFMKAMTMTYSVKDNPALTSIDAGDEIAADVVVQGDDYWLENIKITKKSAKPKTQP